MQLGRVVHLLPMRSARGEEAETDDKIEGKKDPEARESHCRVGLSGGSTRSGSMRCTIRQPSLL